MNFNDPKGTNVGDCNLDFDTWCGGGGRGGGGVLFHDFLGPEGIVPGNWYWISIAFASHSGRLPPPDQQGPGDPAALSNRELMSAALDQAIADLAKPDCAKVFAGGIAKGHDPVAVLQAIVLGTQYGSVSFKDLGAGTGAVESSYPLRFFGVKKVTITINSGIYAGGAYWNNGYANVNALTLLHELGHAFNDLFGRGSSAIINDTTLLGKVNQAAEDKNAATLKPCGQ
ncbi:MAG: hypothetical protein C5B51_05180 [Terriglobia bacterium]|nr:MAG: hypothetical protein C5B51_05180 [Terriglobia bacterium]